MYCTYSTLFFKKNTYDPTTIKKILLINLQGIGDLVVTTPLLTTLCKAYPSANIEYLCYGNNGEIFVNDKRIDAVHAYHGGFFDKDFFKHLHTIRSQQYDLCLNLFRAQHSAFLTAFSGARYIAGPLYSLSLFRNFVLTNEDEGENIPQEKTRNLRKLCHSLALALGISANFTDHLSLVIDSTVKKKVQTIYLTPFKKTALRIVINAGSVWPTKCWDNEHWAKLILQLQQTYKGKNPVFYFIGSKHDTVVVQDIITRLFSAKVQEFSFVNLTGKFSLQELAAFLSSIDFCITVDSGPMHIAAALQIPTIALFGVTQPALLVHENKLFKAIKKPSLHKHLFGSCYDFHNQPLPSCHIMMLNITVEDVMKAVSELSV